MTDEEIHKAVARAIWSKSFDDSMKCGFGMELDDAWLLAQAAIEEMMHIQSAPAISVTTIAPQIVRGSDGPSYGTFEVMYGTHSFEWPADKPNPAGILTGQKRGSKV